MSMIQDSIKAKGQLNIVVTGPDGKVKENYLVLPMKVKPGHCVTTTFQIIVFMRLL
jgi:hypothetical protein